MKTQKEPKEKENKTGDNLKYSLNFFLLNRIIKCLFKMELLK